MPCPGDAGAPFEKMPMVMAALHPTGEVGLVGSGELPQPDSIAANATHTGIRVNIRNLPLLDDDTAAFKGTAMLGCDRMRSRRRSSARAPNDSPSASRT